jgi:hypothetical protein
MHSLLYAGNTLHARGVYISTVVLTGMIGSDAELALNKHRRNAIPP